MSKIKLKICGIQSVDEASELARRHVDYIGLNFVPSSKRCISLETAFKIVSTVKDNNIQPVLLFQNQSEDLVNDYVDKLGINLVQLHGSEKPEKYTNLSVIKAIHADGTELEQMNSFPAEYYLLDRKIQGIGNLVNQETAEQVLAKSDKVFIAGGLNPENLAELLNEVKPFGIDIAGGVRTNEKLDLDKVDRVIEILESA